MKVLMTMTLTTALVSGTMIVSMAEESYTTKPGDSLSKIAEEAYGDAHNWRAIYERNKDQIKDPDLIWSNQTLILPDLENASTEQQVVESEEQLTENDTVPTDNTAVNVAVTDNAAAPSAFVQNLYNLMAAKDYAAAYNALLVEGEFTDTAGVYLDAMEANSSVLSVYIPDGGIVGTGLGIYNLPDSNVYLYYGDYVDGVRTGNGALLYIYGDGYEYFEGTWSNDAPNGQGTRTMVRFNTLSEEVLGGVLPYNTVGSSEVFNGSLVNGLWDGVVTISVSDMGYYNMDMAGGRAPSADRIETYNLSFVANNGVAAEDKTDEYLSHLKYLGYTREDDGWIVYAFDGYPNGGVEDGVEQYYDDGRYALSCKMGTHLGIARGHTDNIRYILPD